MGAWRPQMNNHFKERARTRKHRYSPTLSPFLPHPARCLLTMCARSVLKGTSARATERASGFDATAHVPGVVAVAIAATAGFSFDYRGRSTEVSHTR